MDVWARDGGLTARFEYRQGANGTDPAQYFFKLRGSESAATSLFDVKNPDAILLGPVQTILGSYYDAVREVHQDDAYWDDSGVPHVLWSYTADHQGQASDVSSPGGGNGKGMLTYGMNHGGSGRLWPLKGKFYGFGCNIWGVYAPPDYPMGSGESRSDAWMMTPDMVWPRDTTPVYLHETLGKLFFGANAGRNFAPAGCAEAMASDRILAAYAYTAEPALPGSSYKGVIALTAFDGQDFSLLGRSDALPNATWAPTYGAPTLKITHDSTDPTRPYVLAIYQKEVRVPVPSWRSEVRVFQLEGGRLAHRFTAQIGSAAGEGLTGTDRSMVVHNGVLIAERQGPNGRELVYAQADGPVQPWKPGLLMKGLDDLTFMKSEGGKLYLGLQRAEFKPYRHDLAELIRVDR
jgi:hypothetical protein